MASRQDWETYRTAELARVQPILTAHGFMLDAEQPHIKGERYLMQAVTTTSGRKIILLASRIHDGVRVVVKATSDPAGVRELEHEVRCRSLLHNLHFAYDAFHSPEDVATLREGGMYVVIRAYIDQERPFIERPLEEQFAYALASFKAQEHAHASAHTHVRQIQKVFERYDAETYVRLFTEFADNIVLRGETSEYRQHLLARARTELAGNTITLERYGDFLTHTDFVPHNFRIKDGTLYLLDLSSIRFGNKYEGWARFANFMALYEPPLLEALTAYLRANRTPEEHRSFRLMRMFRLGEILWYYTQAATHSEGDLQKLNRARIEFWTGVLASVLDDAPLNEDVRLRYIATRDTLRSPDERERQLGLH